MSTIIAKHCLFVRAQPAELWTQVSNPRTWPNWHPALKAVEFKGGAAVGARGQFYLASGPASPFEVTSVCVERQLQLSSPLLWLGLVQEIRIVEITEGCVLIFEVSVSGTTARLVARALRRLITGKVERAAVRLKASVERASRIQATSTKSPSAATTA